jgi:acetylglutamate kinase
LEEAIQKADVLIEALGWIRTLRDKITVIKLGGSVLENEDALRHLLLDIVFMETVGMRPVVVHGGGTAISRAMDAAGLEPKFIQGRRVTDTQTLEIVEQVLCYEVNEALAEKIEALGGRSMPLNFRSSNVLYGEKIELLDDQGIAVDVGYVGTITRVDRATIENFCYAGTVPVIPSMCLSEESEKLNVNADTAASAVAKSLDADKLVFLSDVNGVRENKEDAQSLISTLGEREASALIAKGAIGSGMIPKIEACLETLKTGVRKTHIIDGRVRHSLLLEIYTNQGVGTEIVKDAS